MKNKYIRGIVIFSVSSGCFTLFCFLINRMFGGSSRAAPPILYIEMTAILGSCFLLNFSLMWRDIYRHRYQYYLKQTFAYVIKNTLIPTIIVVAICLILVEGFGYPASVDYLRICGIGSFSLVVMHILLYAWIRHLSQLGYFRKNILIVGTPDPRFPIECFLQDIGRTRTNIGTVWPSCSGWRFSSYSSSTVLPMDGTEDFKEILCTTFCGQVLFFCGEKLQGDFLLSLVNTCRSLEIGYSLVPDISSLPRQFPWNRLFPYIPLIDSYSARQETLLAISIKRMLDILLSIVGLAAFLPFGLLIAGALVLEDRGPVFYTHVRIGKNGKPIRFIKFRTMVVKADELKDSLKQHNARTDGPLFKMRNDPRVTKVGRILRKFSIDEVPQFLNVLGGSVSLVGPRPHLPEEVACYHGADYLRLECMPGIVGLPQVRGRDTIGFREWVDLDLEYRRTWSVGLDLKIMLQTVMMLTRTVLHADRNYF